MKRTIIFFLAACLLISNNANSQDLLKKAGRAVINEIKNGSGGSSESVPEPEPPCSCNDAELVVSMGGSLKLDYKETNISVMDDGSLLMQDKISGNYFIVKNGTAEGPFQAGDTRIAGFENSDEEASMEQMLIRYKNYISRKGDKYVISFGGKTYGPYGEIRSFTLSVSKEKFAAMVVENVVVTEMDGKAMDEAMKKAKTDQEKMQLAMQYSQQMQQKIMGGGGPASITPKLVSNIPDASYDLSTQFGSMPDGKMKFDDILMVAYDKIYNLQGKQLMTLKSQHIGSRNIFINSANTAYATYNYGTLSFSDGKTLTDLFNPHLMKTNGQVYLAYMYYSPGKNALMRCKIAF